MACAPNPLPFTTFNLWEAANYLRMHPEELRRRAKLGEIPGAKVGKCWVFILQDLVEHIRSLYPSKRQEVRVTSNRKELTCHSQNEEVFGGSSSPRRQATVLDVLLEQPKKPRLKNSMTK
ncbi:helix-turn-helix domain-containing protein [Ferriphaselus amnicola]|uniref:helix-turn-helix domain-containing protein n=1 Tax=Ferriphaselus amnicola TaxID=1188319 RepID=UPI002F943B44